MALPRPKIISKMTLRLMWETSGLGGRGDGVGESGVIGNADAEMGISTAMTTMVATTSVLIERSLELLGTGGDIMGSEFQ